MGKIVKFVSCSWKEYNSLSENQKDNETLFFIEDIKQIYKGKSLFSNASNIKAGTANEWNNKGNEIPDKGTLLIYSDRSTYGDEFIPDFKIADGITSINELPFYSNSVLSNISGITFENNTPVFNGKLMNSLTFGGSESGTPQFIYDGSEPVNIPLYNMNYIIQ